MRTIRLTLMYDGTRYAGWQIQKNGVSVQGFLQDALRTMTGERISLVGASRTDAGVHALGQVAHFRTEADIPCEGFRGGLNSILPHDIAVTDASEAPDGFHARRDAKAKRYLYRLLASRDRSPLLLNRCWQIHETPDVDAMKRAASLLVGEHDYSSFRAAGCAARHARRRVEEIGVTVDGCMGETEVNGCHSSLRPEPYGSGRSEESRGPLGFLRFAQDMLRSLRSLRMTPSDDVVIDFQFYGDGFVRHMVRNIVGTLVDVGLGKIGIDDVPKIIAAQDRKKAGRCAPACGLYLVEIIY